MPMTMSVNPSQPGVNVAAQVALVARSISTSVAIKLTLAADVLRATNA